MTHLPSSPFAALSPLSDGRELTVEERRLFERAQKRSRYTLGALLVGLPVVIGALAYGATRPAVDQRIRSYANGARMIEAEYIGGDRDGTYVEYYRDGGRKTEGTYDRNRRTGLWKTFYTSGQIRAEGVYQRGRKVGVWNTYFSSGQVRSIERYDERGVPDGLWEAYFEDGTKEYEMPYRVGRFHGTERVWREDGGLLSEVNFEDGQLSGRSASYDGAGHVLSEGQYVMGERNGPWRFANDDGSAAVELWDHGQRVGPVSPREVMF